MARVRFKEGQPIQSLSGKIGNLTYRTRNGKTFVHVASELELPEGATRKQKALYKRRVMVDECVTILQEEMDDFIEAIQMRTKIRDRIIGLYKKYSPEIKARTKLQRKIMGEYRKKWLN